MDIATALPPEIFDPVRLRAELGEPQGDAAPSGNELTGRMRQAFREGRARVRERFEAGGGAEAVHRELTRQTDVLIQGALDYAEGHVYGTSNPSTGEELAVVAVGGYGRGELAPQSDVDLLFLHPYKRTPHVEQMAEFLLFRLYDLGLTVGQLGALGGRVREARQGRPHGPHRTPRDPLRLGLPGALRGVRARLPGRGRGGQRPGLHRGQARRARRPAREARRLALPARAQHQGGQGRPARPAHADVDRPLPLRRARSRASWSATASSPGSRSRPSSARAASCGRCAATSTTSPAGRRSG